MVSLAGCCPVGYHWSLQRSLMPRACKFPNTWPSTFRSTQYSSWRSRLLVCPEHFRGCHPNYCHRLPNHRYRDLFSGRTGAFSSNCSIGIVVGLQARWIRIPQR